MFKDNHGNYKLKIAFDFDDTLTERDIFLLAQRLIKCGHDVWIMTARISSEKDFLSQYAKYGIVVEEDYNADLYEVARLLGLEKKIIFVNLESKSAAYKKYGFDLLFDDDATWHCNPICEAGGIAVNI